MILAVKVLTLTTYGHCVVFVAFNMRIGSKSMGVCLLVASISKNWEYLLCSENLSSVKNVIYNDKSVPC